MTNKIEFTIYGQPYGKVNMKPVRMGKHLSLVQPQENNNYMAQVQSVFFMASKELELQTLPIFEKDAPLKITITAYYKIQSVHFGKKGLNAAGQEKLRDAIRPTLKPDCDNISKVICDALNGVAWYDDSQIVELSVKKHYAVAPRVEVTIEIV